jgi:tungstate ABC transporter binding protein WtpA
MKNCVPQSSQQLIIYRAGSLTRTFEPLIQTFTCQTGIQVTDVAMGSVDAARQITAGGPKADIYAPADYLNIDLLMKPAGYAEFNIAFARGRMVLAYSENGVATKGLPPIAHAGSPKAVENWHEILLMPAVTIGGGHPFLDPGAYRGPMVFQLAEAFYKVPNLYNDLLKHEVITGSDPTGTALSLSQ